MSFQHGIAGSGQDYSKNYLELAKYCRTKIPGAPTKNGKLLTAKQYRNFVKFVKKEAKAIKKDFKKWQATKIIN